MKVFIHGDSQSGRHCEADQIHQSGTTQMSITESENSQPQLSNGVFTLKIH